MKKLISLPVYNRNDIIQNAINSISKLLNPDSIILIIDDGSDQKVTDVIEPDNNVKILRHENSLGYGGCFMSTMDFAQHNDISEIYFLDISYENFTKAYTQMSENLPKCDILNISRYTDADLTKEKDYHTLDLSLEISTLVNSAANLELTDVFSPFKAVHLEALNEMTLEEFDEALIIQLFIQGSHFKKQINEIFCDWIRIEELNDAHHLSDDFDYYKNFIEGEKIIYPV